MNFIKISEHYINMNNVIHLIDEEGRITLFFNTPKDDRTYTYYFEDENAKKLREWLDQNSTKL